jgi:hypothetical protein
MLDSRQIKENHACCWWESLKGKRSLERPGVGGGAVVKSILKNKIGGCGV